MPIRVSGLNSGLDTDAIVQELVSAYRTKGDKIKKQQTKLSWTQDKWKSLNAKVLNLYKSLDSLRFSAGYNIKKTTVSDMTKATVTAGQNAVNGTQTLRVNKVAKSGYLTGGQLKGNKKGAAATLNDLADLAGIGPISSGTYVISGNGVSKEFDINGDTKISEFVEQLNSSGTGVQASYDEANQRLFISSKTAGKDADFNLVSFNEDGQNALRALGVSVVSGTASEQATAWMKYYDSDSNQMKKNLTDKVNAMITAKDTYEKRSSEIETYQKDNAELAGALDYIDAVTNIEKVTNMKLNGTKMSTNDAEALSSFANMSEADLLKDEYVLEYDAENNYTGLRLATSSDKDPQNPNPPKIVKYSDLKSKYDIDNIDEESFNRIKAYNADVAAANAYNNSKYKKEVDDVKNNPSDLEKLRDGYEKDIDDKNKLIKTCTAELKNAEKTLQTDSTIDSDDIKSGINVEDYVNKLINKINYFNTHYELKKNANGTVSDIYELKEDYRSKNGGSKINGQDAEIELNGETYTSSSNTFNINGLTIQAQAESKEDIMITTATDTQGLYDKIKDFISEYNSIINEMSTLYNAPSSKGYEPLTSEEKEALSESEISDWEKKIKDSLLRRDGNLSTLMNVMTSAMSKTYEINGKKYSLASLGIKTGSYFSTTAADRYELHIDGDPDDDTTSANADKLMEMLNSDPDTVIGIIQGAANELSENLSKQMKSSTLRSYQSIYNDKAMAQSYSDYTKKISAWEEKVTAIEESYYKKFAAMEKALAKLQSQQSAFSGMLGS